MVRPHDPASDPSSRIVNRMRRGKDVLVHGRADLHPGPGLRLALIGVSDPSTCRPTEPPSRPPDDASEKILRHVTSFSEQTSIV